MKRVTLPYLSSISLLFPNYPHAFQLSSVLADLYFFFITFYQREKKFKTLWNNRFANSNPAVYFVFVLMHPGLLELVKIKK